MTKIVYAEGCSITAGAEHTDWHIDDEFEICNTTWAHKVKDIIYPEAEFFSTARTATSQSGIRRRAFYYLHQLLEKYDPKDIVVLIGNTHYGRVEQRVSKPADTDSYGTLANADGEQHYIHSLNIDLPGIAHLGNALVSQRDRNKWLMGNRVKRLFNEINYHHSASDNSLYKYFTDILFLRNFCALHGIKIYETIAVQFPKTVVSDNFVEHLQHLVNPVKTIHHEQQLCFTEFCEKNKLPQGPGGHPLEEANQIWAESFIEFHNLSC